MLGVIPCLTFRLTGRGGEVHSPHKVHEPGMPAQIVKERFDAEKAHGPFLSLICFLQKLNGAIVLVKTESGRGKSECRHIAPGGKRFQFAAPLHRFVALVCPRVCISQQ